MPKIAFSIFVFVSFLYAYEGVLTRKHAFAAGIDFALTKGDLDGVSRIYSSEGSPEKEIVILPEVPFFVVYAFDARALLNASSIAMSFGLGYPSYEHQKQSGEARYWRAGLEYQYHLFWPELFRVGIGLGYGFSSMRFPKGSFGENSEPSYANFHGNGPNAVLSANCYFSENLAVEAAIRYRLLYFNEVSTDLNDVSRISPAIWQSMGELGLRAMFVF
ncbi:MAG: hypothetical protein LBH25_02585 [Fibromonadaceae bacterium]|nr:hypothetical protein [Fibromonadaceae bacterium]